MPLPSKVPAEVKTLRCTNCAGPLTIRDPYRTLSVACPSCGSVLDARDPALAVLVKYASRVRFTPAIPFGKRGTLRGEKWECTGMLVRQTEVEGTTYRWTEYLLANPYKGYRWLVEQAGHWLYVRPCLHTPEELPGRNSVFHREVEFKCFQTCTATVAFVLGELYWQLEAGERAIMSDYVAPPKAISSEISGHERNWSIGEYIEAAEVRAAFGTKELPYQTGVAPAQPNPLTAELAPVVLLLIQFLAVAAIIHAIFVSMAQDKLVLNWKESFLSTDAEKSRVSPTFEMTGHSSPVLVKSSSPVSNHWVFLGMALINEETNVAYDFGREISFYAGVEDGETWTEGSTTDEVTIPAVPAGKYFLRVEPQSDMPDASYSIEVYRAPTQHWPFWLCAFLLVLPPVILKLRQFNFEITRWKESDYPIIQSTSEE